MGRSHPALCSFFSRGGLELGPRESTAVASLYGRGAKRHNIRAAGYVACCWRRYSEVFAHVNGGAASRQRASDTSRRVERLVEF